MNKAKPLPKPWKKSVQKNRTTGAAEYCAPTIQNLPSLEERLKDLAKFLTPIIANLNILQANQSYLPAWEKIYSEVHKLKGLTKILPCSKKVADWLNNFCNILQLALNAEYEVRDTKRAAKILQIIQENLFSKKISSEKLQDATNKLQQQYTLGLTHAERMHKVEQKPYMDASVSKKAYAAKQLQLPQCTLEETIQLEKLSVWRKKLDLALQTKEGEGILISFLPTVVGEADPNILLQVWVAGTNSHDKDLLERLRKAFPKALIKWGNAN